MRLDIDLECVISENHLTLAQIEPIYVPDTETGYDKRTEDNPVVKIRSVVIDE